MVGLTVRAHQANSHKGKGWQKFTDAVISAISKKTEKVSITISVYLSILNPTLYTPSNKWFQPNPTYMRSEI